MPDSKKTLSTLHRSSRFDGAAICSYRCTNQCSEARDCHVFTFLLLSWRCQQLRIQQSRCSGIGSFVITHFCNIASIFRDWFWQIGMRPSDWRVDLPPPPLLQLRKSLSAPHLSSTWGWLLLCCAEYSVRTDMLTLAYCHAAYASDSLSSRSQKEISHSQWIPMSVIVSLVPVITNIEILLYAALNGSITSERIPGTVPALPTAMSRTK
jgi:hypothetical protein